jgi:putative nucleotidyltransferase with HDIG domain
MGGSAAPLVEAAYRLAAHLLRPDSPRMRHTVGVARSAAELTMIVPGQEDLLMVAAWLHDIGYSRFAQETGYHPLDGAALLARNGWPTDVVALVAQHSGAQMVADAIGLGQRLRRYRVEDPHVLDALTYADQTTGPIGEPMTMQRRLNDMLRRHGPDSPNWQVHAERGPYLLAVGQRVEAQMQARLRGSAS